MTDVEWLEPADDRARPPADAPEQAATPPPGPATGEATGRGLLVLRVLDVVLSTVAVGILAATGFGRIYTLRLGTRFSGATFSLDGWGRFTDTTRGQFFGQYGPRFGILTAGAAGLVLVGLALRVAAPRRLRAGGVAAGVLGVGLAVGALGGSLLETQSVYSTYRAAIRVQSLDPSSRSLTDQRLELDHGWFLGLGVTGAVLASLAVLLPAVIGTARQRELSPRDASPAAPPPFDPDDEDLFVR